MIYTLARTKSLKLLVNEPIERVFMSDISWYWVDFEAATEEEITTLRKDFKFDNSAIEECLGRVERPKVNYYDTYNFLVLHALDQETLKPNELDLFVGKNYVVSFHLSVLEEITSVRQKMMDMVKVKDEGHIHILYFIMDKIVDQYFPLVYRIEDTLNDIDIKSGDRNFHNLIDQVFEIRSDLLKLRHTVNSMKELMYRILNSEHMEEFLEKKRYLNDIYDHLLKLSDIIEINREFTSDIRDNYLSINSHKMNKIMTILTIISSIFIPLTFIVGVYGMNFDYMPELRWRYGYFIVLGFMAAIGISMIIWFIRKGWVSFKSSK